MAQDHDEAHGSDGQVDEEDPTPVREGDNGAAEDGADHRAEEGGHGQDRHGPDELGLRRCAQEDQAPHGPHQGARCALGDSRRHQGGQGPGEAAGGGGQGVEGNGGQEDPPGAELVCCPAADRQADGSGQHVHGDGEVEAQGLDVQGPGHGRQGVGQDRGIEGLHEQGRADDGWRHPSGLWHLGRICVAGGGCRGHVVRKT